MDENSLQKIENLLRELISVIHVGLIERNRIDNEILRKQERTYLLFVNDSFAREINLTQEEFNAYEKKYTETVNGKKRMLIPK